jgi:general secretion pathway protein K
MTLRRPGARRAQDRGAALILVIWAIGLMAVIAALIARDSHLDALEGNRLRDAVSSDMLIESGRRIALARLSLPQGDMLGGFPILCDTDNGRLLINARPVTAFVDLNASQEETLASLFVALGAREPDAVRYAAGIADYRDGDTRPRVGGAENAEYQRAGLTHGPANRPFTRTGEISEVLGLPAELIAAAMPHLTVHSHTPQVDPVFASREVLSAVNDYSARGEWMRDDGALSLEPSEVVSTFAGAPVVIEIFSQTRSGFRSGIAATYSSPAGVYSGPRRLVEERSAATEPVLPDGIGLPAPTPCF